MPDFVAGDTNSLLVIPCLDQDGAPITLTGYYVVLRWRYEPNGNMAYRETMTKLDQDAFPGYVSYRWTAGQLVAPSIFYDAVIYNESNGRFVTQLNEVRLNVRKKANDPGSASPSASPSGSPTTSVSSSPSVTTSSSPSTSVSSSESRSPSSSGSSSPSASPSLSVSASPSSSASSSVSRSPSLSPSASPSASPSSSSSASPSAS